MIEHPLSVNKKRATQKQQLHDRASIISESKHHGSLSVRQKIKLTKMSPICRQLLSLSSLRTTISHIRVTQIVLLRSFGIVWGSFRLRVEEVNSGNQFL